MTLGSLGGLFGGGKVMPIPPSSSGPDIIPTGFNTDRGSMDWSNGGGGGGWSMGGGGGGGGWSAGGGGGGWSGGGGGGGGGWSGGGGGGGWSSKGKGKGDNSTAISALTLLAFLFFLNILQNCLKDSMAMQTTTPATVMMVAMPAMPATPAPNTRFRRSADTEGHRGDLGTDDKTEETATEIPALGTTTSAPQQNQEEKRWMSTPPTPVKEEDGLHQQDSTTHEPLEDDYYKEQLRLRKSSDFEEKKESSTETKKESYDIINTSSSAVQPMDPAQVGYYRQARSHFKEAPGGIWKFWAGEHHKNNIQGGYQTTNVKSHNLFEKHRITTEPTEVSLKEAIEEDNKMADVEEFPSPTTQQLDEAEMGTLESVANADDQETDNMNDPMSPNVQQSLDDNAPQDQGIESRDKSDTSYRFVTDQDEELENEISPGNDEFATGWGEELEDEEIETTKADEIEEEIDLLTTGRGSVWTDITLGGLDDVSCHSLLVCEVYRLAERWGASGMWIASGFSEILLWMSTEKNRFLLKQAVEDAEDGTGCGQHIQSCGEATRGRSLLPLLATLIDQFW